ncbi:prepilin-type N-terminal cleavage/methylation domain-containing protein [Ruminococcus sp.]|uniref:PulJ/GspJ family protein n=1 Tax=Ruminococcus sp. TaxID=41978 RepID=UPI002BF23E28|nr:prepilin-type N-terminal cleavage/methylation domain-containing protein [Ruminococcus sp.]HNZ99702.1 prepilin-type N-terminal cleavage/methylation domain-containing protein [Ruminococcus sp.]HOH86669.1 prepilin-type N-terminal cleavage/methylation domain-containing protein [Ruminococcus sp.]
MKKSKKKLKGMTLIEMIISIAIFAIMGGLLVLLGTHIDNTTKATNKLKNKIVEESPYAANHQKVGVDKDGNTINLSSTPITITVEQDEVAGKYYYRAFNAAKGEYELVEGSYQKTDKVELSCDKYATEDVVTAGMTTDAEKQAYRRGANGELNLEFVDINNP